VRSQLCDSARSFAGGSSGEWAGGRDERDAGGRDVTTLTWQLGQRIGRGAFAEVFQAINAETGELMAVKQVSLPTDGPEDGRAAAAVQALRREIDLMRELEHRHIVRYLGTERTEGHLNIFLEYVSGGSITSLLSNFGTFEESLVRKYTRQILIGLDFLHSRGIVHCDIKGGNILVTEDGVIKLADFNSSKHIGDIAGAGSNPLKSLAGTPQFMAPEVIRQTGHGKKADIWSVGCTVIQMMTGNPPWDHMSNKIAVLFHIASAKEPPKLPEGISCDGAAFLRACFTVDPTLRPSARALVHHDWLAHLSRSLPASAFDSDPVGPLGPGPPPAAEAAAPDDEAVDGEMSLCRLRESAASAAAELEVEVHGRGPLRSSISTPCLQQAGNEAGWPSD